MDFNLKLQELRKEKGLTQEELAEILFVSRTAVSKWESGRGYPSIDSLKAISIFFSVTIDDLLSGEEILTIAEKDNEQKENNLKNLVFGLLDLCSGVFFFLPFFGENIGGEIKNVSLLSLTGISSWLLYLYCIITAGILLCGIIMLCFKKLNIKISIVLTALGVLVFIISRQPYPAALLFVFFIIKMLMVPKKL